MVFIQLITIGGFIWLAAFGHFDHIGAAELWKLGFVIAGEYIGVGLGTAAFCRLYGSMKRIHFYTATQLALFTSLLLLYQVRAWYVIGLLRLKRWATIIFLDLFIPRYPRNDLFILVAPWNEKEMKKLKIK